MSELRKPFPKKIRLKNRKPGKMPHIIKKPTSQKGNFGSNKKVRLELTMNGLGKPLKKSDPKN